MRVLSGIQPSGKMHLGNYFGYVQPNIDWHKTADAAYIMIADLHALTTVHDPKVLTENIQGLALDLLSCGFDPEKTVIFRQSQIAQHTELFWILATLTPMGLLERAVSFKDKVDRGIAASVGLFTYPALQAADILLYDIDKVPVGKDQTQHLEMSRDIAIKFNNTYGEVLVVPEGVVREEVAVVPGTDGQKMSKSYGNTIPLFGDEKTIKKAIMGITTDSKGMTDPKDPETCTIYKLHALLLNAAEREALAAEYRSGLPYGEAKKKLLADYVKYFAAANERRNAFLQKPDFIQEALTEGAKRAAEQAHKTMSKVRAAVGLGIC